MRIRSTNILSFFVLCFSVQGITFSLLYTPISTGITFVASLILIQIVISELTKQHFLVQKKQIAAMVYLAFWILMAVYNVILALAILIYLEQYQSNAVSRSQHLQPLMVFPEQQGELGFTAVSWINLTYYFGQAFSTGFYARAYYRYFFVENIVNIYRVLKRKVKVLNESLLSALPIIDISEHLEALESVCALCLESYDQIQELTKLPCNHYFHRNCIRIWVVRSNACPLCRRRVIF